jgi:hypothetical protein
VRQTPEASALGLSGLEGEIYGHTTPSATGIAVIGSKVDDYALNVFFTEKKGQYWFSEDQLEFLHHSPGTEITIAGIDKKWVRASSGAWEERPNKPWWKFW